MNKWNYAKDELPLTDERVLCVTVTKKGVKNFVLGYYDGERWCCGMNSNVYAWMYLPQPPEVEE